MEKKGVLRREAGRSRNIVLNGFGPRTPVREVPVYGMIPAGVPEGQEQEADRSLGIDPQLLKLPQSARLFALEVRGESMTGAGIHDRDLVILEVTEPRPRDIVAALIDGAVTLKRYLIVGGATFSASREPRLPRSHSGAGTCDPGSLPCTDPHSSLLRQLNPRTDP